jgi:hypothetical protein
MVLLLLLLLLLLQIMSTFLPYVPQEQGSTTASATNLPMTRVGTSNTFRGTVAAIIRYSR